jgi:pilus assembly protein CpaB
MGRSKGWIWIGLALVCAISAGALTYVLIQRQNAAAAEELARAQEAIAATPKEETVTIPVAAVRIERGATVTLEQITTKEFPVSLAPSSAMTQTELIAGQTLTQPIAEGDIFRTEAFYGGAGATLSAIIEPGRTIISIPVLDLFSGTGLFVEGDRIDMLLSYGDSGTITGYTVQNVRIIRILAPAPTEEAPNPAPSALLLEVDPEDAVMIKKVKDSGGVIDMALRSPLDEDDFDVDAVTDDELIRLMNGTPDTTGNAAP